MFTVDTTYSDQMGRKSNSVVGIHAQQGSVSDWVITISHIHRNAMNNIMVKLQQQMNTRMVSSNLRSYMGM